MLASFNIIVFAQSLPEYITLNHNIYSYYITDFNQLEDKSDLVIKAKVIENIENVLDKDINSDGKSIISYGCTLTNIEVKDTFRGISNRNDVLTIIEPYYTDDTNNFKVSLDSYIPCNIDEEYIFFLNKENPNSKAYNIVGRTMGKFPIPNSKISTLKSIDSYSLLSNPDSKTDEIYRELYRNVLEKYLENNIVDEPILSTYSNEDENNTEMLGNLSITLNSKELEINNKYSKESFLDNQTNNIKIKDFNVTKKEAVNDYVYFNLNANTKATTYPDIELRSLKAVSSYPFKVNQTATLGFELLNNSSAGVSGVSMTF